MASVNQVTLMGHATKDPKMASTKNGKVVAKFNLAVNRKVKQADGSSVDVATFIPIVAWGGWATGCELNVHKGTPVFVQGYLNIREYPKQDGTKGWSTEVVAQVIGFLKNRAEQEGAGQGRFSTQAEAAPAGDPWGGSGGGVDEPMPDLTEGGV